MRAQILHLSGPLRGHTRTYAQQQLLIGTSEAAEVRIPPGTPGVAERHAQLEFREHECTFHLQRLDGRVFVNQKEIEEVILEPEDLLELGLDGPKIRFRIYVPAGSFCKPVRQMLTDATQVGAQSGAGGFASAFLRDLFTHATLQLKIGFPLAVIGLAFLAALFGGWLGGRSRAEELLHQLGQQRRVYEDELTELRSRGAEAKKEQESLRADFEQRAAAVDRWISEDQAMRHVLDHLAAGVCLLQGAWGYVAIKDGKEVPLSRRSLRVENVYTGSGFLVSAAGDVVTNRHVAQPWWTEREDVERHKALGLEPRFWQLRAWFPKQAPVDVDPATIRLRQDDLDVATLKVEVKGVPVLPLSETDPARLRGQRVLVLGYPTGINALLAKIEPAEATTIMEAAIRIEVLSARLSRILGDLAQIGGIRPLPTQGSLNDVLEKRMVYDASTTHGGSGGPVFGPDGRVVAVNFAILEDFGGSNFGVPIRFAAELLR